MKNSPDSSPSEHSKRRVDELHGGPSGRHLGANKTVNVTAKVLLTPGKKRRREVVPSVRHLCS
jgi:hypothetical protein